MQSLKAYLVDPWDQNPSTFHKAVATSACPCCPIRALQQSSTLLIWLYPYYRVSTHLTLSRKHPTSHIPSDTYTAAGEAAASRTEKQGKLLQIRLWEEQQILDCWWHRAAKWSQLLLILLPFGIILLWKFEISRNALKTRNICNIQYSFSELSTQQHVVTHHRITTSRLYDLKARKGWT